ncbi:hypothetical protein Aperf_G00000114262 [Anoplocephala perfoliata]
MFAVIQLASSNNKSENLAKIVDLTTEAANKGAKMVFLPEAADFIGSSKEEIIQLAEHLNGNFFTSVRKLSKDLNIWLSIGSMHRRPDEHSGDQRLLNSHIVLDCNGEIAGLYDKTHLFTIDLNKNAPNTNEPKRLAMNESHYIQPGKRAPVVVRGTPVGEVGLAICYDLRFPELASALRYKGGANVLAYPSAFSFPTGSAGHWHTLLRARAIENQCYVIAAAQDGVHNPKFKTYGHSMVVDPSGRVVAERTESGPGIIYAQAYHQKPDPGLVEEININYTDQVRLALPVESSRRHDIFSLPDAGTPVPIGTEDFRFGTIVLKAQQVFYRTSVSMAFVNISPLVPGHVLVTPIDVVERFVSLPYGTIADMYACVKRICTKLCEHFGAQSSTISIQDGKDAGQSVPHVHIHVLPRKPGDFAKNDDIYDALQRHDKVANRKYRSEEEMTAEAKLFRSFFYDFDGLRLEAANLRIRNATTTSHMAEDKTVSEDKLSQFLAREKDELGELANDLPVGNEDGFDVCGSEDSKRDSSYVIDPEGPDVRQNSSSTPSVAELEETTEKNGHKLNGSSANLGTPSPVPPIHENAFMESWKANFEADIKARDEREVVKREELEATAKKELATWYAHYRQQMSLRSADNRAEAPRDASGRAYDGFSGTAPTVRDTAVWESVCKMCDLTSKNPKSTHDLSRMRGLLLNLKTPSGGSANSA